MSAADFEVPDYDLGADTHVIELGGEIDLYTASAFKQRATGKTAEATGSS